MLNQQFQAMRAMELHLEDEMLAGFGALHMVRDEEENKPLRKLVCVSFFSYYPTRTRTPRTPKARGRRRVRRRERRTGP